MDPLYFLFGALTALLLTSAFLFQLTAQAREAVDEQAQGLLEAVARAAFSLLPGEGTKVDLPPSVGGGGYEFWVEENGLFLRVLSGVRKGKLYSLELSERAGVENSSFGREVYLHRTGEGLLLSSSPLLPSPSPSCWTGGGSPPPFYSFAREHPLQAAALLAAHFSGGGDTMGYAEGDSGIFVLLEENIWVRVEGRESRERAGRVESAWVVERVEGTGGRDTWENCPSVREAVSSGWVFSPSDALSEFLGRAWRWEKGRIRAENLRVRAAAVSTETGSFPVWRFDFTSGGARFVVYWRMVRWWYAENSPGFLMQSGPELEPL